MILINTIGMEQKTKQDHNALSRFVCSFRCIDEIIFSRCFVDAFYKRCGVIVWKYFRICILILT